MPIIADVRETRLRLHDLFERRHILVHELPDEAEIDPGSVDRFVSIALRFCDALDQSLSTELYGDYPLTQLEMNGRAGEKAQEAEAELQALIARLDPEGADTAFRASQGAWRLYRERQAEYRSDINSPARGSIAPMIHASEVEKITRARIEELRWYLEREEGEM